MRPPQGPLPRDSTWETSNFSSGLTTNAQLKLAKSWPVPLQPKSWPFVHFGVGQKFWFSLPLPLPSLFSAMIATFLLHEFLVESPEGPERHLNAARQKLPRANLCPLICHAITPPATGAIVKEEQLLSLVGERQFRRHFKEMIWLRAFPSQKLPWDNGESFFCRKAYRCLAGPSGNMNLAIRFCITVTVAVAFFVWGEFNLCYRYRLGYRKISKARKRWSANRELKRELRGWPRGGGRPKKGA